MPLLGRSNFRSSNIVQQPIALPYPLYLGQISYSDRFNEPPSATIEYQGIPADQIEALELAYPLKARLNFYGVPLEVTGTEQTLQRVVAQEDTLIEVFAFRVALKYPALPLLIKEAKEKELLEKAELQGQLAYSSGLVVKPLGAGNLWSFSRQEILEIGQTRIEIPSEGYNDAVLTWPGSETSPTAVPSPAAPEIEEIEEGSEDLELPPDHTKYLRDSTSNHDESGPTKFYKYSRRVNGTPDTEELKTWGFAYNYEDIALESGQLYTTEPENHWQLIEERSTKYIYRKINGARWVVEVRDPLSGTGEGRSIPVFVHPDFARFADISGLRGQTLSIESNNLFLTEVETTGRKLLRLVKETDDRNTLEPTDPRYPLMKFRWVPYFERTAYLLKVVPEEFGGNQALPFRIEFQDYTELDPRIKEQVNRDDLTGDGKAAVLFPDPAFVEPFYIATESNQANSYEWALDPDGEVEEQDPPLPPKPPPHFMVGQESENFISRRIIKPAKQRFSEFSRRYSAQDPQFEAIAESVEFTDKVGSLPNPQVRQPRYEEDQIDPNGTQAGGEAKWQWRVTTPDVSDRIRPGGSVEIQGAKNISEATQGLLVKLRRSSMAASQGQFQVAWFYPEMKPGDALDIEGYRHRRRGVWRITDLSWTHRYQGSNNPLGAPLVTCEGMNLSVGLDANRPLVRQRRRDRGGTPTLDPRQIAGSNKLGQVLPPLPNRRNF